MTTRIVRDPDGQGQVHFPGTIETPMYAPMYISAGEAYPFSNFTILSTEPLDQVALASAFCGLARDARPVGQTQVVANFPVITDEIVEFDCPSCTPVLGNYVGASRNNGGTAILNTQVELVPTRDRAIGIVTQNYTAATTRVKFRLLPSAQTAGQGASTSSNVETITANKTLTILSPRLQVLDDSTGLGKNVILPAETSNPVPEKITIVNNSTSGTLTLKASNGSTTIGTVTAGGSAITFCDGTAWRALTGGH